MGRSFWILWSGQTVSALGDAFGSIAMGWAVYELTGSKLAMGSLFLVFFLPQVVLWIFGGPLLDMVNRRHLMIALDLARTLAYAIPPLLAATHHLALWHLYALAFVEGSAGALFWPASLALVPSLVAEENLVRANSLSMGAMTTANLIGPVLAGLLIAGFSSQAALLVDSASFGVSVISLFWLPAAIGRVERRARADTTPYLKQLADGYRFFGRTPALLLMMIMLGLSNMGGTVWAAMLIPWVREQVGGGATVLGIIQAAVALGALGGTVVAGRRGDVQRRHVPMLCGLAATGLLQAAMALVGHGQVAVAIAMVTIYGFAGPFWDTHSLAIYQRVVPDQLRGRVMSVRLLVGQGLRPIGALLGALVADRFGLPAAFLLFGLVPGLFAASGFFMPLLRWVDGDLKPVPYEAAVAAEQVAP